VPRVHGGTGTAIISTSTGVMTGHEAKPRASAARSSPTSGEVDEHEPNRKKADSRARRRHVEVAPGNVAVKGPKGELTQTLSPT
jgi:hypothetical protein